jgi:hypothetical protein
MPSLRRSRIGKVSVIGILTDHYSNILISTVKPCGMTDRDLIGFRGHWSRNGEDDHHDRTKPHQKSLHYTNLLRRKESPGSSVDVVAPGDSMNQTIIH